MAPTRRPANDWVMGGPNLGLKWSLGCALVQTQVMFFFGYLFTQFFCPFQPYTFELGGLYSIRCYLA